MTTLLLKSILLVEDDLNDVELTLATLAASAALKNPIVAVRDGAEALDYLRRQGRWAARIDGDVLLVLLDKKLPKVDGYEVLAAMRGDAALRSIPVVMLTSSRDEMDLLKSYQLGVDAYVVKPVEVNDLTTILDDLGIA